MAFQELVNFGLHSKRSPWNATNFYEMFGVSRDGAKDLDDFEFHQIITEAWAKRLVDIPTVSSLYFLEPNGSSPHPPGWDGLVWILVSYFGIIRLDLERSLLTQSS